LAIKLCEIFRPCAHALYASSMLQQNKFSGVITFKSYCKLPVRPEPAQTTSNPSTEGHAVKWPHYGLKRPHWWWKALKDLMCRC